MLGVLRRHPSGTLLGLVNVTGEHRPVPHHVITHHVADPREVLSHHTIDPDDAGLSWMPPYAAWWIIEFTDASSR